MIQFFRFFGILFRFWWSKRPTQLITLTPFKVRLPDIDSYIHMNNARYLSIMDLSRMDLMFRSRWARYFRKNNMKPVIVDVNITYRKELKPGTRFVVESKVSSVEKRKVWVDHRFLVGDQVHAEARVGLLMLLNSGGVATTSDVETMVDKVGLLAPYANVA